MLNVRVFDSPEQAGLYAATLAEQVIQSESKPVLGLATGGTPVPFYRALENFYRSGLDLSHVTTINLDEYVGLAADHPQSYHDYMNEHLFSRVNIPPEHVHIPNGLAEDLEAECERYDAIIRDRPIHLQLLGVGVNGHIGFNEPSSLLVSKTHVVQLHDETIQSNARFFRRLEDVPRNAITMGVQAILQANRIVLMAFGEEKADIIAKAIQGGVATDVPASILQLHANVTVVLDRACASLITLPFRH